MVFSAPPQSFCKCIHLSSFAGCFLLAQAMIELHEQSLGKRLTGPINPAVVEDLGVLAADPNSVCSPAVQIRGLTLLPLKRHPPKRRAAWETEV